ncbi:BrnT family toxin [uncultured Thiodictyon sp.]|uniref:BrnT family toxin n=1 Tax=uncultured Thiodictyon sp. TaxID=1846217 RepID=UPI0025EC923B|nr:BrnT family toxin [uncultured Thiodictyon sp.]
MHFQWDEHKNRTNLRKHGVDFRDAVYAFADPHALNIPDDDHSQGEERWVLLGVATDHQLLLVVHTDCTAGEIRLISARRATRQERATYQARLKR